MLTLESVAEVVCRDFDVSLEDLRSRGRRFRLPRQVAMYICSLLPDVSDSEIGSLFDRKHSSVRNARYRIGNRMREDPAFKEKVRNLFLSLKGELTLEPTPPKEAPNQEQRLARAEVHFKSGAPPLMLGPCAYQIQPHPILFQDQLVATLVNFMFDAGDNQIHIIPNTSVDRLVLEASAVALAAVE